MTNKKELIDTLNSEALAFKPLVHKDEFKICLMENVDELKMAVRYLAAFGTVEISDYPEPNDRFDSLAKLKFTPYKC